MTRRGTLIIERSHLRTRAVVLRDKTTRETLHSHPSTRAAVRYCRQNGYGYTFPLPLFAHLLTTAGL